MKGNKTSLLIGATGFVGFHLAPYLLSQGERVVGTYFHKRELDQFNPQIRLVYCNVNEPGSIGKLIKTHSPRYVYYLAAQSSVRVAWYKPIETMNVNLLGGVYLLETLRKMKSRPKVLIFSSGVAYGSSHTGRKVNEQACLIPKDPYGVSKMGIDYLSRLYARVYDLNICVVRLSSLTGPGQSTEFSIANFASQIARIEKGKKAPVIEVGNLSAERDYLDVHDGVEALYLAMKRGKKGEAYNISSGKKRALRDALKILLDLSDLKKPIQIRRKGVLVSKDEIKSMSLDASKFMRLTGWKSKIAFRETLADILHEWQKKIV